MMEGPFQHMGADGALAVLSFKAWGCLIEAFKQAGQLSVPKRVALVVKPMYHALLLNGHALVHDVSSLQGLQ